MILYASGRTDIPRYYGEWFMNRIREGYLFARNPLFPSNVSRYSLTPETVDAIVFCSKDYVPFLDSAAHIASRYRTLFQYTVTAYGSDLEPKVPPLDERIRTLRALSEIVGSRKLLWRYDPVLLTPRYDVKRHLETFAYIAEALRGHVARCTFSFVEVHVKLLARIPDLIYPSAHVKQELVSGFGQIAAHYGIPISICGTGTEYDRFGVPHRGCATLGAIGEANGCAFRDMNHTGNRRGCSCFPSRDAGAYETCPSLCKYCYANLSADRVTDNMRAHDPASPLLIGTLGENDRLMTGKQASCLLTTEGQLSLFDL